MEYTSFLKYKFLGECLENSHSFVQVMTHECRTLTRYRCVRNCGMRTNVQKAVELRITSSDFSVFSAEWSVTPPIDWQRDSGTGNNRQTLIIYANVLQPGTKYNISVQSE